MPEHEDQKETADNVLEESFKRLEERTKKKQIVHRSDAFDVAFFGYVGSEDIDWKHQTLTEKRFTLKRSDVGTRIINHWESEGVTEDPREDGTGWRRFSILDMVWLHAVARLRSFGMSIEKLKRARKSLARLGAGTTAEGSTITFFEFYVIRALLRVPVYLIVFEDGEVELATEQEYSTGLTPMLGGLADHVRINLNAMVQRLLPKFDLHPNISTPVHLSDDEVHVLLMLRTGNYQSVTVKYHDGEIKRIEAEEDVQGRRIIDILRDEDYQDITIKRRDGKDILVSRTLLKKI
jgi:hypothetical protein